MILTTTLATLLSAAGAGVAAITAHRSRATVLERRASAYEPLAHRVAQLEARNTELQQALDGQLPPGWPALTIPAHAPTEEEPPTLPTQGGRTPREDVPAGYLASPWRPDDPPRVVNRRMCSSTEYPVGLVRAAAEELRPAEAGPLQASAHRYLNPDGSPFGPPPNGLHADYDDLRLECEAYGHPVPPFLREDD